MYGLDGGRTRAVTDSLALAAGCYAICPDLMDGSDVAANGGFGSETGTAFLRRFAWPATSASLAKVGAARPRRAPRARRLARPG